MDQNKLHKSNVFFYQAILIAMEEFKEREPYKFIGLFHSMPRNLAIYKIGWLKKDFTLKKFCDLLNKQELINFDFEFFKLHFKGTDHPISRITWQSNLNELVYLFSRLRDEEIILKHKTPHLQLQDHFLDKYGKPIKAGSLRTLLEKGIRDGKKAEIIDRIVNDILHD
jgi:hypothetical protein